MRHQHTHNSQVMIDHRAAPAAYGVAAGQLKEMDVRKCCGCQRMVVMNQERERSRHYCRTCDSFMCDDCALTFKLTGTHTPFSKVMADWYDAAHKNVPLLGG